MADKRELQDTIITLKTRQDNVREKLSQMSIDMYDMRLNAELSAYYTVILESFRETLDECVKLLT